MNKCPNCLGLYDEFEPVRCPLCGYVLKPEICNVDPKKYFLPEYAKSYEKKVNHNLMGTKFAAGLFGFILLIQVVYAFERIMFDGIDSLNKWLFKEMGLFGIIFIALTFSILCVFSSKNRTSIFKSFKAKIGMIREFLNKGGL